MSSRCDDTLKRSEAPKCYFQSRGLEQSQIPGDASARRGLAFVPQPRLEAAATGLFFEVEQV